LPSVIACAVTLSIAGSLAGCGVAEEDTHPGVAAKVDGQTLELRTIDSAVTDYCDLLAGSAEASAVPKASVRSDLTRLWAQAVAVEAIAPDFDVDLPSEVVERDFVERAWSSLGAIDDDNYDSFEWLTWVQLRVNEPLLAIGAQLVQEETGQSPDQETAAARAYQEVDAWLADNDLELNPVFGHLDDETGLFTGDALSIAVSGEAKDAVKSPPFVAEQVAALPATQRCGPPVDPAAQVQPGS
jgi:hypothetical protein